MFCSIILTNADHVPDLASFSGQLLRRWATPLDPQHLLRFVLHRLNNREAVEVVVLKELILNMAGIEPVENLSEGQITALTCGPTVAIEALASSTRGALQARPLDRPTEKLMTALVKNDLAVPLLILLAQHRQSYVFRTHNASLKTLSSLFDEVRVHRNLRSIILSLL